MPSWSTQIGSFDYHHVAKHMKWLLPQLNAQQLGRANWTLKSLMSLIHSKPLVCRSLNDLLRRHSIGRPSVLLIDAESFDCKLVAMTDWCEAPPSLLVFEGKHCKGGDLKAAVERLAGRNLTCTAPRWKLVANVEGADGNLFFTIVPKDFTHTGDRHSSLVAQSSRRSWDT